MSEITELKETVNCLIDILIKFMKMIDYNNQELLRISKIAFPSSENGHENERKQLREYNIELVKACTYLQDLKKP